MNLEFSQSAEVPGQAHSTLNPHQIACQRVTASLNPSCGLIKSLFPGGSEAAEVRAVEMVVHELMDPAPSSTTLLYHTLVQDGAVPPGFQQEVEGLAPAIEGGTAREARKAAATSEFDAALFLHERSGELRHKVRAEKSAADQLLQAATVRPCKNRARYLRAQFQGPSAREDAEESERADLLRGTQSPMGQFLAAQPGNQLTGGGRRASTLRSRVRGVKRFLSWMAMRYELTCPLPSASSQSACRCVSKKVPITRLCSWRPWPGCRHKTVSLTVSCTTSCIKNS